MSKKAAATQPSPSDPQPRYMALVRLWHTRDLRYVQAGEPVDLSHLTAEQIERLIKAKQVSAVTEARPDAANGQLVAAETITTPAITPPTGDPKPPTGDVKLE